MVENSERLDGLKHISQTHRSQFDERRRMEWKLVFAVIAFFLGIITTNLSDKIISGNDSFLINQELHFNLVIIFFVIVALSIIYLLCIHSANYKNKKIAEDAENAISDIVNGEEDINFNMPCERTFWEKIKDLKYGLNWSWFFQMMILFFICLVAIYVLF